MLEAILFLLLICLGILIILGLISVFLGGFSIFLGGAVASYEQPNNILYLLYFSTVIFGLSWILLVLGVDIDIELELIEYGLVNLLNLILLFHLMNYLWCKIGLVDLPEPPKIRWFLGSMYIFIFIMSISSSMIDNYYLDGIFIEDMVGESFVTGLVLVWWASTEKK